MSVLVDVHIRRLREKIETNPKDKICIPKQVGYYFRHNDRRVLEMSKLAQYDN